MPYYVNDPQEFEKLTNVQTAELSKNKYNKKAELKVEYHHYDVADYSRDLKNLNDLTAEYSEMKLKYESDKIWQKDIGISDSEMKRKEEALKRKKDQMELARKKVGLYDDDAQHIMKYGPYTDSKVSVSLSNKVFFNCLAMAELDNMLFLKSDEKNYDSYVKNLSKEIEDDLDPILHSLMGTEQVRRCRELGLDPLRLIVIDGQDLADYAYKGMEEARLKGPDGNVADLASLLTNKEEKRFLKAKALAALVDGKADFRILRLGNAEKEYEVKNSPRIKLDMSAYQDLEKVWIDKNKGYFKEKRVNTCFDNHQKILPDQKTNKEVEKGIQKQIASFHALFTENKHIRNILANMKADSKRLKEKLAEAQKGYHNDINIEGNAFLMKPQTEGKFKARAFDDSYILESTISGLNSANMLYNPSEVLNTITNKAVEYYDNTKDTIAGDMLKRLGLISTYIKISYGKVFSLETQSIEDYKRKKEILQKNMESGKEYNNVYAGSVHQYVLTCFHTIAKIRKKFDELNLITAGSYYTLNGAPASIPDSMNHKKYDENLLSPNQLEGEERREYISLKKEIDVKLQELYKLTSLLYSRNVSTDLVNIDQDFLDDLNRLQAGMNLVEIRDKFDRYKDLTAKIFAKTHDLGVAGVPITRENCGDQYNQMKENYEISQSELYYRYKNIMFTNNMLVNVLLDPASPLAKVYAKERERTAIIKKKPKEKWTPEEAAFMEKSVDNNFQKLIDRQTEYESFYFNMKNMAPEEEATANKAFEDAVKNESAIYPKNFDRSLVEEEMKKQKAEPEEHQISNSSSPNAHVHKENLPDKKAAQPQEGPEKRPVESMDQAIEWAIDSGNLAKLLQDEEFKKRYDEIIRQAEEKLTDEDKFKIQKVINEIVGSLFSPELAEKYKKIGNINIQSEKDLANLVTNYENDKEVAAILSIVRSKRKSLQDQIEGHNIAIEETKNLLSSHEAILDYWSREIEQCKVIQDNKTKLNTARENAQTAQANLNDAVTKHTAAANVAAAEQKLTDQFDNLVNSQGKYEDLDIESMTISQLMKMQIGDFKLRDAFVFDPEISPEEAEKTYGKMTLEKFTENYMETRLEYDTYEAFENKNKPLLAMYKVIDHMQDEVFRRREAQQKQLEDAQAGERTAQAEVDKRKQEKDTADALVSDAQNNLKQSVTDYDEIHNGSRPFELQADNEIHKDKEEEFAAGISYLQKGLEDQSELEKPVIDGLKNEIDGHVKEVEKLTPQLESAMISVQAEKDLFFLNSLKSEYKNFEKKAVRHVIHDKLTKNIAMEKAKEAEKKHAAEKEAFNSEYKKKEYGGKLTNVLHTNQAGDANKDSALNKKDDKRRLLVFSLPKGQFRDSIAAIYALYDSNTVTNIEDLDKADGRKFALNELTKARNYYNNMLSGFKNMKSPVLPKKDSYKTEIENNIKIIAKSNFKAEQFDMLTGKKDLNWNGSIESLIKDIYPAVKAYVDCYEKAESLISVLKLDVPNALDEKTTELLKQPGTASREKWQKLLEDGMKSNDASENEKKAMKELKALVDKDVSRHITRDAFGNVPKFTRHDLQVIGNLCINGMRSELEIMKTTVDEQLNLNQKTIVDANIKELEKKRDKLDKNLNANKPVLSK